MPAIKYLQFLLSTESYRLTSYKNEEETYIYTRWPSCCKNHHIDISSLLPLLPLLPSHRLSRVESFPSASRIAFATERCMSSHCHTSLFYFYDHDSLYIFNKWTKLVMYLRTVIIMSQFVAQSIRIIVKFKDKWNNNIVEWSINFVKWNEVFLVSFVFSSWKWKKAN